MEVNVSKCAIGPYTYDKERKRTHLKLFFQFRGKEISNLTMAESIRYLGMPIMARKTVKFKYAKFKLKEMEALLEKIISSSLFIIQKIDAIKTFVLSLIDFSLLNGEIGIKDLEIMEKRI
jgi:hypothetical protein